MKQDLVQRLQIETEACKKYARSAAKKAKEQKIGSAINLFDIAKMAKTCADQVHEELWEVSKVELTDEEFKIFTESETLRTELEKAYKEILKARQ